MFVSLHELARRAEVLARKHAARRSFESALSGMGQLRVDPARIEQAVLILVHNAAKYGPAGSLVRLSSELSRSGQLRIRVEEDRGAGIPSEELPHVFERFYRVDKTRTRQGEGRGQEGTGLPIAKTIVQAHDGRIEILTQPEEGTKVALYLPLLSAPRHAEDRAVSPRVVPSKTGNRRQPVRQASLAASSIFCGRLALPLCPPLSRCSG